MNLKLRSLHTPPPGIPLSTRLVVALLLITGAAIALYPMTARYYKQVEQSGLIDNYATQLDEIPPELRDKALADAHQYNKDLNAGAAFDPFTQGVAGIDSDAYQRYLATLEGVPSGVMARVKIPSIEVDLPVYHGTTDATLKQGVGHLFGTALPVGGVGTRSTLTAHSGLADAVLFTFLDRVKEGDLIHVEVYGERYTYRVFETRLINPEDADEIAPDPNRDLLTLVTCMPIGINSQRLIVTGERIPTVEAPKDPVPAPVEIPGFPWWVVYGGATLLVAGGYVWLGGKTGGRHLASDNAELDDPDRLAELEAAESDGEAREPSLSAREITVDEGRFTDD
ncbi:class C sortase [Gulosibacter bifidus]|uniref:Class C sortase n=1 Tax=Gulosibacter bifidus TaxID=272239 RepID=A0ABW5RID0_9MICO|nr:class C sortase [Gulosibacter bifidus]